MVISPKFKLFYMARKEVSTVSWFLPLLASHSYCTCLWSSSRPSQRRFRHKRFHTWLYGRVQLWSRLPSGGRQHKDVPEQWTVEREGTSVWTWVKMEGSARSGWLYYLWMTFLHAVVTCTDLANPDNGVVEQTGKVPSSTATYECNLGYILVGASSRTCQDDGTWSGEEPICEGEPSHVVHILWIT